MVTIIFIIFFPFFALVSALQRSNVMPQTAWVHWDIWIETHNSKRSRNVLKHIFSTAADDKVSYFFFIFDYLSRILFVNFVRVLYNRHINEYLWCVYKKYYCFYLITVCLTVCPFVMSQRERERDIGSACKAFVEFRVSLSLSISQFLSFKLTALPCSSIDDIVSIYKCITGAHYR